MVSEIKAEITYSLKIWPGIMAVAALIFIVSCAHHHKESDDGL